MLLRIRNDETIYILCEHEFMEVTTDKDGNFEIYKRKNEVRDRRVI